MPTAIGSYCVSQTRQRMKSTLTALPVILYLMKFPNFGFRRVESLPPYVFAQINELKRELRHAGRDVIDLGFGNPDIPSPAIAVEKLREAALRPVEPPLLREPRAAAAPRRRSPSCTSGASTSPLDPETQVVATIGAKEALVALMWVLVEPGDVGDRPLSELPDPSRSLPRLRRRDDRRGAALPVVRGCRPRGVRTRTTAAAAGRRSCRFRTTRPRRSRPARICSARRLRAASSDVLLVHDFAYADIAFDGYRPPSLLRDSPARSTAASRSTA